VVNAFFLEFDVSPNSQADLLAQFSQKHAEMLNQLRKVVVGQSEVIDQILAAIFTRGHALLVGVPGLAKTLMVSSISQILDVSFKRVQFTPDLMPSDITGTMIFDEQAGKREFRFVRGPVFTNILLADEINRTPPKTQAALLEAMQERQVTAGQDSHRLPDPFFVLATQNPIEQEGTYPLPEAQLDRFMFTIRIGYPSFEDEKRIVALSGKRGTGVELTKVLSAKAIVNIQNMILNMPVGETVTDYAVRLVRATRPDDSTTPDFIKKYVSNGAGPRASIALCDAGRAFAAMDGRASVAEEDIRRAAIPVLRHRIVTNFSAQAEGKSSDDVVRQLLTTIGPRDEEKYARRKK
jgi:MoxR-like ATPase